MKNELNSSDLRLRSIRDLINAKEKFFNRNSSNFAVELHTNL